MRIEFLPDGSQDCPAVLFYGCPSAGAEALINTFRLLGEAPEREVALHELADLYPVGDIQVFATNATGHTGVQQLSPPAFRWRKDREGWLAAAELAEPVAHSDPSQGTKFQYLERYGRVNVSFSTVRGW
jgi:hypothetical protein